MCCVVRLGVGRLVDCKADFRFQDGCVCHTFIFFLGIQAENNVCGMFKGGEKWKTEVPAGLGGAGGSRFMRMFGSRDFVYSSSRWLET